MKANNNIKKSLSNRECLEKGGINLKKQNDFTLSALTKAHKFMYSKLNKEDRKAVDDILCVKIDNGYMQLTIK